MGERRGRARPSPGAPIPTLQESCNREARHGIIAYAQMVRTYAFNPSTQSQLSASLPALPTSVLVQSSQSAIGSGQQAQQLQQREPVMEQQEFQQRQPMRVQLPPPDPGGGKRSFGADSLSSTASSTATMPSSLGSSAGHQQVLMEEERTHVLGLRSVLINGQRFYQPIAVPAPSSATSGGSPMDPISPALIAIATATISENGNSTVKMHHQQQHVQQLPRQMPPPAPQLPASFIASPSPSSFGPSAPAEEAALPWARGNPQPKCGQRGSRDWQTSAIISGQKNPFDFSFGGIERASLGGTTAAQWGDSQRMAQQERHRLELMQQIEENRERKRRERQREWEMDERERIKNELYQQRVRMELEEERRREREKALVAEMKAAKLAAAQRATEEAIRAAQQQRNRHHADTNNNRAVGARHREEDSAEGEGANDDGLEWWERKDRRRRMAADRQQSGRGSSPVVPALQAAQGGGGMARSLSVGSRRSSESGAGGRRSRNSRLAYESSSEARGRAATLEKGKSGGTFDDRDVDT